MKGLEVDSFVNLLEIATKAFYSKVEEINAINYFPVVDHDTGTNMYATLKDSLLQSNGNANCLVSKLVLCSKGNSGIIMAKALSGFLMVMLEKNGLKNSEDICQAVISARDNAYNAVLYPKDGTMLTFLDVLASNCDWDNLNHILDVIIEALEKTLVDEEYDAGAKGLYYLIEFTFSLGLDTHIPIRTTSKEHTSSLKFQYCTEFVVVCKENNDLFKGFISQISALGESIAFSYAEGALKVHIHNNNPFVIFALASTLGQFLYKKIDNMSLENGEMHHIIFVVDDNGDLFAPFTKFNVEYISLASSTSDRELAHKMDNICSDTVYLLTNTPERYKGEEFANLKIIKTYGLASKVAALLCKYNTKQNEYIEDMEDFARICQDSNTNNDDLLGEKRLTEAQIKDLFSFPNN